jgi:hypothetical protein
MSQHPHSGRSALGAAAGHLLPGWASASASDGWVGTRELPGYRAGQVVVKLADLPGVAADHLYVDVLLLDGEGRTEDTNSGGCAAMHRRQPLEQRSRFVRVAAELLRHAPDVERGLASLGAPLAHIREQGIEGVHLAAAAQQLDVACSETALVASLAHMLVLSFGEDEAQAVMRGVLAKLARIKVLDEQNSLSNDAELTNQVGRVVRLLGKVRARRFLREATDFDLLPAAELFGL